LERNLIEGIEKPPFKMKLEEEISRWRYTTFFEKEPETVQWVWDCLKLYNGAEFMIDVGCNIGIYSMFALSLSKELRVIGVEPAENNVAELLHNIELNKFSERFKLITNPLAAKQVFGNAVNLDKRVGATGFQFTQNPVNDDDLIRSTTLDSVILNNQVHNCFVKIDVDGIELEILMGAEASLKSGLISSLLVETTINNYDSISEYVSDLNYVKTSDYENMPNHSSVRRRNAGNIERNIIFRRTIK